MKRRTSNDSAAPQYFTDGFNSLLPASGDVFVTHCNSMAVCNAAMQISIAMQHPAYIHELK
jgi:hypothetical protein